MIQATLTKPNPNFTSPTGSISFRTFTQNATTAYALFNRSLSQLSYFNPAFLQIMRCDAYALEGLFPSATLLGIPNSKFEDYWAIQLDRLDQQENITFEWQLESRYGEHRVLKVDLWKLDIPDQDLAGIKLEDITSWKKLRQESRQYVKIY